MGRREDPKNQKQKRPCALWYNDGRRTYFINFDSEEEAIEKSRVLRVSLGRNSIIGIQHSDGTKTNAEDIVYPPLKPAEPRKPHEAPPESNIPVEIRNPFDPEDSVEVWEAPSWMRGD